MTQKSMATRHKPFALIAAVFCWPLMAVHGYASPVAERPSSASTPILFEIPGQELRHALLAFGKAAGVTIFFDTPRVAGRQSQPLTGAYTKEAALARLLAGTGLTYHFTSRASLTIEAQNPRDFRADASGDVQLETIDVQGEGIKWNSTIDAPPVYAGGQVASGAQLGLLGNRKVLDTPFNITSYTSALIENQQARTIGDVLANDPSVRASTSAGHIRENFRIRGFSINDNEIALNGLYGIAPQGRVASEFLERVEVLKGPSALLNGMPPSGSIGGSINAVTKHAQTVDITSITGDYTSRAQGGVHLDVSRRFGAGKEFGVRYNGVYRSGETEVTDLSKTRGLNALALDYKGDKFRLVFDGYLSQEVSNNGMPTLASFSSSIVGQVPAAPSGRTNLFRGVSGWMSNQGFVSRAEYDLLPDLTFYAAGGLAHNYLSGFTNGTYAFNVTPAGAFNANTINLRGASDTVSAETGARARFEMLGVNHQLVFSANILNPRSGIVNVRSASYNSNIYSSGFPASLPGIAGPSIKTGENVLSGLALADTLSMAQDRILLTLGLRAQHVQTWNFAAATGLLSSSYDKTALTPAIGLVLKPFSPNLSFYVNYIEGLSPGSTVTDATATNFGTTFAPFVTRQTEAGVKWEYGSITNTLAAFSIEQPSVIRVGNAYSADGRQRNRGIEWNVFGEVYEHVRVLGGASFLDARYTQSANNSLNGFRAFGNPNWSVNLGAEWDTPFLPALTLEGRVIHTGSLFVNSTNTQWLPSWTRLDLGARYVTQLADRKLTLRSYVTNVTDNHYWEAAFGDGYASLGAPRTFTLSATMDF